MVDTISKNIILRDNQGRIIKELKAGMTARVTIETTPIYKINDSEFSNIINNKKKETNHGTMG